MNCKACKFFESVSAYIFIFFTLKCFCNTYDFSFLSIFSIKTDRQKDLIKVVVDILQQSTHHTLVIEHFKISGGIEFGKKRNFNEIQTLRSTILY